MTDVLNLFSGIGADLGIEQLGLVTHGIDNEPHVAATRIIVEGLAS